MPKGADPALTYLNGYSENDLAAENAKKTLDSPSQLLYAKIQSLEKLPGNARRSFPKIDAKTTERRQIHEKDR